MSATATTTRPSCSDHTFFSSSKVSNAVASSSSSVLVKTRIISVPAPLPKQQSIAPRPPILASPDSPRSSPFTSPPNPKKRRASPQSGAPLPREVKRLRESATGSERPRKRAQTSSSKRSSRGTSPEGERPPSPEPIYRSSRSRSTSAFPAFDDDAPILNRVWATEENGEPGEDHLSSEDVVRRLMRSYKAYFKNLDDPSDYRFRPHPTKYPVAELEYPNSGAVERFILLAPKDKDHYNPIMDLEKSLYTIVEFYLTPQQQDMFGPIPNEILSEAPSPPPSPSPSPPRSRSSSISDDDDDDESSGSEDFLDSYSSDPRNPNKTPLLRAVQRAIHRQDGLLFLSAMEAVNRRLNCLKYPRLPQDMFAPRPPNPLTEVVRNWQNQGLPKKVLMRIIEENYQRSVGPHVHSLKQYEAFTSTVYGELMPSLVHEMLQRTKLKENSLFLDLGSGVGNVVTQASLQTGCRSYGVEILPAPAKLAREMKQHLEVRCRMWGIKIGDIELEEGNMLESPRVDELMPQADVVLVDNKVFEQSLNEALRPKFLDLKEGAIVISLKPFVASLNARLTERNVDDISTIFDVTEHPYYSGSVSWGNGGGSYYVHRVDRTGYADIRKRFESSRAGSQRTSRLRK